MKKVIISTDYSIEAENAMNYAAAAAAQVGYEIILFNFDRGNIHLMNARSSSASFNTLIDNNKERLKKVAERLARHYHITVHTYFGMGDYDEEINKCIEQYSASMVVVGMAQKSLEQDLMGNTTTKMLHLLKIPTLAIPSNIQYKPIKNILFACDILRGVQKRVLKNVRGIAKDFQANVEVFYVSKKLEEIEHANVSKTMDHLNKNNAGLSFQYKNVESSEIIHAIEDEIEVFKADILIMVPYKYGFWGSIVHRSRTRAMASGNKVPLLSIPL